MAINQLEDLFQKFDTGFIRQKKSHRGSIVYRPNSRLDFEPAVDVVSSRTRNFVYIPMLA